MGLQHLLFLGGQIFHQGIVPTCPIHQVWQDHKIPQGTPNTLTTECCPDMLSVLITRIHAM